MQKKYECLKPFSNGRTFYDRGAHVVLDEGVASASVNAGFLKELATVESQLKAKKSAKNTAAVAVAASAATAAAPEGEAA